MIKGIPARTIKLTTDEVVFVENELHVFMAYKMDGQDISIKITGEKNILAIRDLLNAAYPVTEQKGGCSSGIPPETCVI